MNNTKTYKELNEIAGVSETTTASRIMIKGKQEDSLLQHNSVADIGSNFESDYIQYIPYASFWVWDISLSKVFSISIHLHAKFKM